MISFGTRRSSERRPSFHKLANLQSKVRLKKDILVAKIFLSICLCSYLHASEIQSGDQVAVTPRIAIIIDDLGYSIESGRLLAQLPYPLTLAIIPGTPHGQYIAALASDAEQELILHIPMEPKDQKKWEEGLNSELSLEAFRGRLEAMLDAYPSVTGINNHGGSLLTADQERMSWVMESLAKRGLYFLDSRTTSESKAIIAAEIYEVENLSRDVFLDNVQEPQAVSEAFDRVRAIARRHGSAVAIGHPHRVTIEQLIIQLPQLVDEGFELTFASNLLNSPAP